jgi:hypothetical protein
MRIILNIGLERGSSGQFNTVADTLTVFANLRLHGRSFTFGLVESDTEPTVVIETDIEAGDAPLADRVHTLAVCLGQEAIAMFDVSSQTGMLLGPRADAWGLFNPEYFILPSGRRLSAARKEIARAVPTTRVFATEGATEGGEA